MYLLKRSDDDRMTVGGQKVFSKKKTTYSTFVIGIHAHSFTLLCMYSIKDGRNWLHAVYHLTK